MCLSMTVWTQGHAVPYSVALVDAEYVVNVQESWEVTARAAGGPLA